MEKLVNSIREKRDDERKKLRPEIISQKELGNDSPSQSIAQTTVSSTVTNLIHAQDDGNELSIVQEVTTTTTTTMTNGKSTKKLESRNVRESSSTNNHRHHRSRRRRSSSRSR